jgi:anaerobic magnesium-protoporphyrin IX monomethyl ester cyclase
VEKERIGLIIPPSCFLADERVMPSCGILKIAAVLERAEWNLSVIDLSGVSNYVECLEKAIVGEKFLFFGITATSAQMVPTNDICTAIRHVAPETPICIGGPHISAAFASERLDKQGTGSGRGIREMAKLKEIADILVAGDGEISVFRVIDAIRNKAPLPLVINADDPETDMFLTEDLLNNTPLPARHLISMDSYHHFVDGRRSTTFISELGCPYNCSFCGLRNSPSFRRVRARSPENVRDELVHLHQTYGFTGFMDSSDEVNIPTNFQLMMREIIKAQEIVGQDFRLRAFIKSNLFTEEQAKLMYEAGYRHLLVGFESGDDRILTNINKKATRDQNTRCMEIATKYGLGVKALLSVGHAGETEKTIREAEKWLLEVRPEDLDITIITVYFGTPVADFARPHASIPNAWTYTAPKTKDRLHFYETNFLTDNTYYKGVPKNYRSFTFTDALSCDDIVKLRDETEENVRAKLGIPFYPVTAASRIETSMGQALPPNIIRHSHAN